MNTPNDNPYGDTQSPSMNNPDNAQGTVWSGFFIGWGLMIGSCLLMGVLFNLLSSFVGYDSNFMPFLTLAALSLPVLILIAAMVWLAQKKKYKTVKGIGASILSMIALCLLLVAACFGILALSDHF